jgi:glucose/arabinose dehydrogenase
MGIRVILPVFAGAVLCAQTPPPPSLVDNNLRVSTVVSGLTTPIGMAFLGANDFLVIEKSTGQVKRVTNGAVAGTVLDLAVNSASERGLLGIALHPDFPGNPGVYLYWTCVAAAGSTPFVPSVTACPDQPVAGPDSTELAEVPLLGNRVDRFVWNGTTLVWDKNLIKLHSFQADGAPTPPNQGDEAQPARGNHNGGVIRFGPDKKLYVIFGDNGRRGQMQNLAQGPTISQNSDDQFGGPEPDNAHFTGVILRLNDDGTAPVDNPFFNVGAAMTGEVGKNLQKVFAYGVRNSFGMAFDPKSGSLWEQENADDAFDEINRVEAGANHGWVQVMGPLARVSQFKMIEVSRTPLDLQQFRWSPLRIADTPQEALSRLFLLPGAHYHDPEFSWKFAVAPAAVGFINGRALGPQYDGDMLVGAATPALAGGYLFRLQLTGNRREIATDDPRLEDRVADNTAKFNIGESETLLFGMNFGIGTEIQTAPDGSVYVVSLSNNAVYRISRR